MFRPCLLEASCRASWGWRRRWGRGPLRGKPEFSEGARTGEGASARGIRGAWRPFVHATGRGGEKRTQVHAQGMRRQGAAPVGPLVPAANVWAGTPCGGDGGAQSAAARRGRDPAFARARRWAPGTRGRRCPGARGRVRQDGGPSRSRSRVPLTSQRPEGRPERAGLNGQNPSRSGVAQQRGLRNADAAKARRSSETGRAGPAGS